VSYKPINQSFIMMHGGGFFGGPYGGGGFGGMSSRRFEEQYHCYSVAYADKSHLEVRTTCGAGWIGGGRFFYKNKNFNAVGLQSLRSLQGRWVVPESCRRRRRFVVVLAMCIPNHSS
jgi:hypothetical protein